MALGIGTCWLVLGSCLFVCLFVFQLFFYFYFYFLWVSRKFPCLILALGTACGCHAPALVFISTKKKSLFQEIEWKGT
mgnify:CR=1 FL=1